MVPSCLKPVGSRSIVPDDRNFFGRLEIANGVTNIIILYIDKKKNITDLFPQFQSTPRIIRPPTPSADIRTMRLIADYLFAPVAFCFCCIVPPILFVKNALVSLLVEVDAQAHQC